MDDAKRAYRLSTLVVMSGIMATTLPQDKLLGKLPLQNLMKNQLHVDRTALATFFFLVGLAWYFKPLFSVFIDAFPLLGTRRRAYMAIGSFFVTVGWLAVGLVPHTYASLLAGVMAMNVFMVITSCTVGGLLVETAQANASSGRLAATRQMVDSVCFMIVGPVSGYLALTGFGWAALACATVAFTLVPVTLLLLKEEYHPPQPLSAVAFQFRNLIGARNLWAASGLMLLFYIAPGTSTALFYKQQNELHMSTVTIGYLTSCTYAAAMATALLYHRLCRYFDLKHLLMLGIGAAACTAIIYLFYSSVVAAFIIDTTNGVGYTLAELAFLDLATRATPKGSESLGYSLMLSVRNLALFGTDIIGSKLLDSYGWSFNGLVVINAATTAVALPLVLLLPAELLARRDS